MPNPYFQFKKFTVRHDKCAMKVGTDGVLLGAWASIDNAVNILDVGTGSGLMALMLAQRTLTSIEAIDIDSEACIQATENIIRSPFKDRICVFNQSLHSYRETTNKTYDLIVSNPPYFAESLKSPSFQRNLARHTDTLSLESLIKDSKDLLAPQGRLALILPSDNENSLRKITEENGLYLIRQTDVVPLKGGNIKRILVEFSLKANEKVTQNTLVIEEQRHIYTKEYIQLTKDYYLKM